MHALIVVSHPITSSLTHSVANHIVAGITAKNADNSADIADLTAEGFDPRFNADDMATFLREQPVLAEIAAEQARIDNADALVLVFPIYWWSMPALLKGWIDRVFSNGWAYDEDNAGNVVKKLQHLPIHLVAIGAASQDVYQRHGYGDAMKTQIEHGIFDYCGATVKSSTLLVPSASTDITRYLDTAHAVGEDIFS